MSQPVLQQWIENCPEFEPCGEVKEEVVIEEVVEVEEPWTGIYYQFLAAPAVMGLGTVVGVVEGAYSEALWIAAMGWGGFMFYFILVWFHEFFRGGPQEEDVVFDNYIGTSYLAFFVLGAITVAQGYKTSATAYPITWTFNAGSTIFGFWMVSKIQAMHHPDPEVEEAEAEDEAAVENADEGAPVVRRSAPWF